MTDIIIIAIVLVIVGLASLYVYKAMKRGRTCIGCPASCSGGCGGSCGSCTSHGSPDKK